MTDTPSTAVTAVTAVTSSQVLDDVRAWFARFIKVTSEGDLDILTLWAAHTWALDLINTTPRLLIDACSPGSGKTTVLDHMRYLCNNSCQAAHISSPALLGRMFDVQGSATLLIDEADRSLDPKLPQTRELTGILNSGYRKGGSRPVLVPKGQEHVKEDMSTYGAVAMAGNSPHLAEDTRSRLIRIVLMPDVNGEIEDSDWEEIEPDARELGERLRTFCQVNAETISVEARTIKALMHPTIRGRVSERWRPLFRIAYAAGGRWPDVTNELALEDIAQKEREMEDGIRRDSPQIALVKDLGAVWPDAAGTVAANELARLLIDLNPEQWGPECAYGKALTGQRVGMMLSQGFKISSVKTRTHKGYTLAQMRPVFTALQIPVTIDGIPPIMCSACNEVMSFDDGSGTHPACS